MRKRHTTDFLPLSAFFYKEYSYFCGFNSLNGLLDGPLSDGVLLDVSSSDCTSSVRLPRVAERITSSYLPLTFRCTVNSIVVP